MPRVTITVPERNSQPYRFNLERKSVSLGRGSENDIVIDCSSVSVHHAVMERIEGGYQLRDLGSTNGTKSGGQTKEIIPLTDGARAKLGDVSFDFSLTADEQLALSKEAPGKESPVIKEDAVETPPAPRRVPHRPAVAPVAQPDPAGAFFMTLVFLVLAVGAFYIGMSLRYSKSHPGSSLSNVLFSGETAAEPETTPAAENEAAGAETPAPAGN
ncbi:MAG: FHA domain-containing protein [Akkermansiaceae bacterium]|jgi:pSer/pThr/pTyr-binding forkhead associated (FHA) protein|nr:FHA domain-containing protein [Akkermansiaceae bacterium]